jgi:dynein heavy chain
MKAEGQIDGDEWMFLLTGGVGLDNPHNNPTTWLPAMSWDELCRLDDLPAFNGLRNSFTNEINAWRNIYDSSMPHEEKLPNNWESGLKSFQKLSLLRCLRPDKIIPAIQNFVQRE